MTMHQTLRKNRFRPNVEMLEDRRLLAGVVFSGNTLTIDFSAASLKNKDHQVSITDDGKGNLTVVADGVFSASTIQTTVIRYIGGDKADTVSYTLTGPLTLQENDLFQLRPGKNNFSAQVTSDIGTVSPLGAITAVGGLTMQVDGGPDAPIISFFETGTVRTGSFVNFGAQVGKTGGTESVLDFANIDAGAAEIINLTASNPKGAVTQLLTYSGRDKGNLVTNEIAQGDKKRADTLITNITLAPGSTNGSVLAKEQDTGTKDLFTLNIFTSPGDTLGSVTGTISATNGNTVPSIHTPNVTSPF